MENLKQSEVKLSYEKNSITYQYTCAHCFPIYNKHISRKSTCEPVNSKSANRILQRRIICNNNPYRKSR